MTGREAFAEKRVALVIGNSAYENAPALPNPANDAAAIVEMYRAAKFDVVEAKHDLTIDETRRAFATSPTRRDGQWFIMPATGWRSAASIT